MQRVGRLDKSANPLLLPTDYDVSCAHCHRPFGGSLRARICSACRISRYCGEVCQREHWSIHKGVCSQWQDGGARSLCRRLVASSISRPMWQSYLENERFEADTPMAIMTFATLDGVVWRGAKYASASSCKLLHSMGAKAAPRHLWDLFLSNEATGATLNLVKDMFVRDAARPGTETSMTQFAVTGREGVLVPRQVLHTLREETRRAMQAVAERWGFTCLYLVQTRTDGAKIEQIRTGSSQGSMCDIVSCLVLRRS